jgi:hypothetical protein
MTQRLHKTPKKLQSVAADINGVLRWPSEKIGMG